MAIKTFQGSLSTTAAMYGDLEALRHASRERVWFGEDRYSRYKRLLDAAYPLHQVEIITWKEVENPEAITHWQCIRKY